MASRFHTACSSIALAAVPLLLAGEAKAISSIFIAPVGPSAASGTTTGASTIPTSSTYTSNLGYAFITGPSGPFAIDGINLELLSGLSAQTISFKISIHGTDNSIAYSAVPSSTAYASDTISVTLPATSLTPFYANLTAVDLPNISAYQLLSNTPYSLFVNGASGSLSLRRTQGYADQTTNNEYTVSNGFTMLDTFRNNTPNYSNVANSYVTFQMSLLGTAGSTPTTADVPGPLPILGALAGFRASRLLRKRIKAKA